MLVAIVLAAQALADAPPWRRRRRPDVRHNRRAASLITPSDWPEEPASPRDIDPERFARALRKLCGWMPPSRPALYTEWIRQYATEFEVDPFLLAALAHRMGRCIPDAESLGGLGLTSIPRRMYGDHLRQGSYRFYMRRDVGWEERQLDVSRFPFSEHRLQRPEENLYFAGSVAAGLARTARRGR